jgi:hypothetical protein
MYRWLEWQEIGGHSSSAITAKTYMDTLYLFATRTASGWGGVNIDHSLHMRSMKAATPWTPAFDSGWHPFPSGGTTYGAVAAAVLDSTLYVFARGMDDGEIYVSTSDGTKWSMWSSSPAAGSTVGEVAAAVYESKLYLFSRGGGNLLYVTSTADGTTWSKWTPFPALHPLAEVPNLEDVRGGTVSYVGAPPAAAVHEGKLHVLRLDNQWEIYVCSTTDGTKWSNWVPVGGVANGRVAAVSFSGGLLVFRRQSGRLSVKGSPDGVTWSDPWKEIGNPRGEENTGLPTVIGGGSAITLYVEDEGVWSRTALIEVDAPPDY